MASKFIGEIRGVMTSLTGSGNDFNNLTESGFYNLYSTRSSTGAPPFDFGTMIVSGSNKAGLTFATQIATERLTGNTWIRGMNDGANAWTAWQQMFADNYHPNADKWTTARTISLSGDASGSVAIDGSANVTIPVVVNNDSHVHTYLSERNTISYGASYLQWMDQSGTAGTGLNGSTPYNPTNDWYHHIIANHANSNGYYVDLALCFHTNNHYINRLAGNGVVSTVKLWNDGNDGSGSGLDADLLDGQHASAFASASHTHNYLPLSGGTLTDNLYFGNSGTTKRGIMGTMADNDFWFIGGKGTSSNVSYMEIATGDDGQGAGSAEPIVISQYGPGNPLTGTLVRQGKLLDENGNTSFPGSVTAGGDVTAYSDERLKSDIVTIPNALATVSALRGVNYVKDGKASTGVIAQEVEAVIPEVVHTADDEMGTKSVAYGNMMGVMIEAVKELKAELEAVKADNAELRKLLDK